MEEEKLIVPTKIVVIGGSAGSLEVLLRLLPALRSIASIALVIVLHRRNSDDHVLEELLRMKSGLPVVEIEDKTPLLAGMIHVAPADYHLLFEAASSFSLDVSEKVHYSRPSIDVAFESAAEVWGDRVVAVLLSGANADGTQGLMTVEKLGGTTVVQSPETAEVAYMPNFALQHLTPDFILAPSALAAFIDGLAH